MFKTFETILIYNFKHMASVIDNFLNGGIVHVNITLNILIGIFNIVCKIANIFSHVKMLI